MAAFDTPTKIYVSIPDLPVAQAYRLSLLMAKRAVSDAPKVSGRMASSIQPYFGPGFVGLQWTDPAVWYQEAGTRPFTMRSLAGKVIPMWIDDPTGTERTKNPDAKTRRTQDGRTQVLIFRRAAKPGQRKTVTRRGRSVSVPMSYPGAPGRIVSREIPRYPGRSTGRIAKVMSRPHSGVRWRHPGIVARNFMHRAITEVLAQHRLPRGPINVVDPTAPEGVPASA